MTERRKRFSGEFKAKVALEAIEGHRTIGEIASEHSVHPNQITQWKKQAMECLPEVLGDKRRKQQQDQEALVCELYQQIGQLKVVAKYLRSDTQRQPEETVPQSHGMIKTPTEERGFGDVD